MKTLNALALINDIREEINENGFQPDVVVQQLKELRGIALEEKNPVVTKALRLAYEHIALHQEYAIEYVDEEDVIEGEDGEEAEKVEVEEEEVDNFAYFMELIRSAENRFNRAELLEIIDLLKNYE